jgi:adenine C2-methylase RlmN of 23S rRNA A2503 and tRNA A37
MLNSPNKTPRKNKKISSLHEAINAPEYIPLNYFNERSYEEQEMEYYQSYQNSMWSHGFGTEHKHNKNKVNFPG